MKRLISMLSISFVFLIGVSSFLFAKEPPGTKSNSKGSAFKADGTPISTLLNINKMSSWYSANGEGERRPSDGNAGMTYPRGTTTAIYAGGLMYGGKPSYDNALARVNGYSYNKGQVTGAILGSRTGVVENLADANVRIWRIRRDYATADLRQDAAEVMDKPLSSVSDGDVLQLRDQYAKDWMEWPASKGAPFYDRNGDGVFTPKLITDAVTGLTVPDTSSAADQPGVADADQAIWYVANDIGAGDSPWKSKPLGIEMQVTIWGYNRTDALGNMIFKKYKIIYKGATETPLGARIDSMYVCQWSDPDLGDAGDDFEGSDIDLSLGYVYNSKTLDKEYRKFNIAPPAAGFDFLQGPIVASAGDSAVFDLKYRKGFKNLPMTSFIYFAAGGTYSDPPFNANGAIQWYQMFRGLPPTPQGPPDPGMLPNPVTGVQTPFWLSGDAVAGTGWVDGIIDPPGDRRLLMNSGPFTLALGDTQEVVVAMLGGLGSDRMSSVSVLKFYDKTAQAAYNNLFDLPKPPVAPNFSVIELDKALILEWEKDAAGRAATENSVSKGYKFEGYNVYQFPSATSPISNAKKLATYDLITDPSTISQDEFDEASGQVLVQPVQLGKNSGLTRYMYITKDEIRNKPLVNGQPYYFAVTAYNYNGDPALVTHSYESSPSIVIATPQTPKPGVVLPYAVNDTVITNTKNVIGVNDSKVGFIVFNPTVQTGATFDVWYGGDGTTRNYTVVKALSGTNYATISTVLSDTNLVPKPVPSKPYLKGTGDFTLNDAKDQIEYTIKFDSLTGALTGAHIHNAYVGKNGGVVKTLTFSGKAAHGFWTKSDATEPLTDSLVNQFTAGRLYVVLHTAANPGGEIRGQISDGLFPRAVLGVPVNPPPAIGSYPENRVPTEGISFYVAPAPQGPKSGLAISGSSSSNILDQTSPDGKWSIVGPAYKLVGNRPNEETVEIRFNNDVNYAIATPATIASPTPTQSYFIKVPFAVYKDTVRVWPYVQTSSPTDTLWNLDADNLVVNGKRTYDVIKGILDSKGSSSQLINYYSSYFTAFPPTSNGQKGQLFNGVNFIMTGVRFVDQSGTGAAIPAGTKVQFLMNGSVNIGDIKSFTVNALQTNNKSAAETAVSKVNVFPNPYYGVNTSELSSDIRFITFNHLPKKATIRIFNLAGTLVTTLEKNDASQFLTWNLLNHRNLPVASGIYLAHIDMGDLGVKILKVAIIMEQQFLQNY